jgi:serine/threonine-protein kinase RsbW
MTAPLRLFVRRSVEPAPDASDRRVVIAVRVPTDLDVVEEAVDLIARHCLACGLTPRRARFNLRVALSEALANAIVYGNALDPAKMVDVRVEVLDQELQVSVRDEGQGFDPRDVPDPTAPDRIEASDGRGLFLIRQLMDAVSFNDRGNAICMTLRRA